MASEGEVWVQLATRIPKQLHRELKLYCVKSDVSVMDFVVSALQDKLDMIWSILADEYETAAAEDDDAPPPNLVQIDRKNH